jgi:hypothetical protein
LADQPIPDGTYVVHSAYDTSMCMDSFGNTKDNNASVVLYAQNGSNAQYVHVTNFAEGSRSWVEMSFPGTGKWVMTRGGTYDGGTGIVQYDYGSHSERWTPVAVDGVTAKIGGKSLQAYRLFAAEVYDASSANNRLIDCSGTAPSSGTPLVLGWDDGGKDQMWLFEQANPMPTGTYEILYKASPGFCLDLTGLSQADGASAQLYVRNGDNNQRVWLTNEGNGRCKMAFCHSMRWLEVWGSGSPQQGYRVDQYGLAGSYEGNRDNEWLLLPRGSVQVGSVTLPVFQVANYLSDGTTMCMDAEGAAAANSTKVQAWPQNHTDAQLWAFMPSEMTVGTLPTPSQVGLELADGFTVLSGTAEASAASVRFECPGTSFKARFRHRDRRAGGLFGDWGEWQSVADGSYANDGWGTAGEANVTFEDPSPRHVCAALPIGKITPGGTDSVELQVEVRSFEADAGGRKGLYAHGSSGASGTIRLTVRPSLTISGLSLGPHGLTVGYASDWGHTGCTLSVTSVLVGGKDAVGSAVDYGEVYGAHGSVLVTWSLLSRVPMAGDEVTVVATLHTDSLASAPVTLTAVPKVEGTRTDPACSVRESDHATQLIDVATTSATDAVSAWQRVGDTEGTMRRASSGAGTVAMDAICPLGTEGAATVAIVRRDGSWGALNVALPAVIDHSYVWDWDGGHAALDLGVGSPAERSDNRDRDYEEYSTTGRKYRAYRLLGGGKRDLSVSGAVVEGIPQDGTVGQLHALLDAGHATFRDWRGAVVDVVVVAVEVTDQLGTHAKAKVRQYQESR